MRFREIVLGAAITLLITVIGGVVVYYMTAPNVAKERLVYTLDRPVAFKTEANKTSVVSLRVANVGNDSARDVGIAIRFAKGVRVVDKKIDVTSGPAANFSEKKTSDDEVQLVMPTLAPDEAVTLSILLDGVPEDSPSVGVKSEKSLGTREVVIAREDNKESRWRMLASILVPTALLAQFPLLFVARSRFISWVRTFYPRTGDGNNMAFLYLHKGMTKDAQSLLRRAIREEGAGAYTLANYGLSLGLDGQGVPALRQLEAAEFYSRTRHEKAVVHFSRALVLLKTGEGADGLGEMRKALALDKKEIMEYCSYSTPVRELAEEVPEFKGLLSEFKVNL